MSKKKSYEPDGTDFKRIHIPDISIDPMDPANISKKILPEQEYRRRILSLARKMGQERAILLIFAKYDKLLRNCRDEKERRDIGKLGCVEISNALGAGGALTVNGELVMKG
jgi:hypothetical protein